MFKKLSLIILGIVLALIISETFLRLAGHFYYNAWIKKENSRIEQEKYGLARIEDNEKVSSEDAKLIKILCVGDSWTFGVGANPGYSYPAQLQLILDRETPDKYKVYNAGIPGCTSTRLLKSLPVLLKKYKPDIIIILVGMNDKCNPELSELILITSWPRRFIFSLKNIILDLRVYKVIRLGLDGLIQKIKATKRHKTNITKDAKPESNKFVQIGYDLDTAGKTDLAKEYFEKAIDVNPDNEVAYFRLGHLYQSIKQYDKALICYERILEINPYTPLKEDLYRFLFLMYQDQSFQQDIRNRITSLVKRMSSDDTFKNSGIPFILRHELTMKNLINNFGKITNLIKSKNAIPVFQTYLRENLFLDDALISFFEKYNVSFIDNRKSLENLPNINDYLTVPDDHPNAKGYYLMTDNVYQKIIEILNLHSKFAVNTERIKLY